ncbi:cytidine deaminase [Butyricimonas hominis]|uniref:Cytidine deaminase n=1 Tax=Butyricimonas hominis TaxID=2763032 RepID=A0ABR7D6Z1_9BACT|nr:MULTISPECIES: cytidine deaminase [Butyricimonas]MBC5623085.1 cytidine deaminase [Butyricimonas hominis]
MEKAELKIDYILYRESYPEGYEELCRAALEITENAYCVYSGFAVGAAVLMNNGEVIRGTNQENAAYPSGLCAERTALFYACSAYPEAGVKAIAVAARDKGVEVDEYVTPCGACRQVMSEIVGRYHADFDVILIGRTSTLLVKASQLLPFSFKLGDTRP